MRTPRLIIEALDGTHAPGLLAALDDERVGRYIGGPDVTTLEALHERVRYLATTDPTAWGERWLNWAVRLADDPDQPVIGRIEATVHIGRQIAEVAYVFGPRWGGHGYATEATAWMLGELHLRHGVDAAWATVDPRNDASLALLARLGFVDAPLPAGGLSSFDDGDRVLTRSIPATAHAAMPAVEVAWRGTFTNDDANRLHAEAFGTRVFSAEEWDWVGLTRRHSLGWVTAHDGGRLVGFLNVVWDGLVHAWIQDVMVALTHRGTGLGTRLVGVARAHAARAGCEWLHVDFDPELRSFYIDACGFRPTEAGLIQLSGEDEPDPDVTGR